MALAALSAASSGLWRLATNKTTNTADCQSRYIFLPVLLLNSLHHHHVHSINRPIGHISYHE